MTIHKDNNMMTTPAMIMIGPVAPTDKYCWNTRGIGTLTIHHNNNMMTAPAIIMIGPVAPTDKYC